MFELYATELRTVDCPYCGESIEVVIDTSLVEQRYEEDCQVCCRPITFAVNIADQSERFEQQDPITIQTIHQDEY